MKKFYDKYFPYIFILLYLVLTILLITRHELWRDEVHSWNIANQSNTLSQFVYNMRLSEGTPYLWNFILYLISHFVSKNIEIIKVIHVIISTTSAFLFLKFAPFNKIIKVLFVFGYFSFFEYSIISRNYAIGILLIFLFCIFYKNKYKNILILSIIIFFIGSCNMYSFFISISFMLLLLIDFIKDRRTEAKKVKKIFLYSSIIIMLSEIVITYWEIGSQLITNYINNPAANSFFEGYLSKLKLVPGILINAYIPIPSANINFWNTNSLLKLLSNTNSIIIILIALILMTISLFLLNKKIRIIFLINLFIILNFMILVYNGSVRHWGYIFILFFSCLWLSRNEEENSDFYFSKVKKIVFNVFIIILLACSLAGTFIAFYYDYNYPFSNGKNVSEYIKKNFNIDNTIFIGYKNYTTETVAGFLDKDFYYPEEQKFSRIFNMINRKAVIPERLIMDAINLKIKNIDKDILVISDKSIDLPLNLSKDFDFKLIKEFSGAIVKDENYTLFLLDRNLNLKAIKKINSLNFRENWKNYNNCELQNINNNQIAIKALTDDPSFESNFEIPKVTDSGVLYIKIDIEADVGCSFELYYKRNNINYNEKDKHMININSGANTILFKIEDLNNLEGIRIDPVNIKQNCIINNIEFYQITKN